jgi:hypothetical protein
MATLLRITYVPEAAAAAISDVACAACMPAALARIVCDYAHLPERCDCRLCFSGHAHNMLDHGRWGWGMLVYST